MAASLAIVRARLSRSSSQEIEVWEMSSTRPIDWPLATSGSIARTLVPSGTIRPTSAWSADRVVGIDDHGLLALEHAERLRVAGHVEERRDLAEPVGRERAERLDPPGRPIPVADDAFVDAHRAGEVSGHQVRDLARVEAARQLGAHVEQPAQLAGEVLGPGQQAERPDGRRGLVGEDRQEAQVVRCRTRRGRASRA